MNGKIKDIKPIFRGGVVRVTTTFLHKGEMEFQHYNKLFIFYLNYPLDNFLNPYIIVFFVLVGDVHSSREYIIYCRKLSRH